MGRASEFLNDFRNKATDISYSYDILSLKGYVAISHRWWGNFCTLSYSMRTLQSWRKRSTVLFDASLLKIWTFFCEPIPFLALRFCWFFIPIPILEFLSYWHWYSKFIPDTNNFWYQFLLLILVSGFSGTIEQLRSLVHSHCCF